MNQEALKDHVFEQRLIHLRLFTVFLIIMVMICALLYRFYFLQIEEFNKYHTKSDSNRVFLKRLPPPRGLVYDRNGFLLAENQPSFSMTIVPDKVDNLSSLFIDLTNLSLINDDDIARFHEKKKHFRSFEQIPIKFNLSDESIAVLAANRPRLEGVELSTDLLRHYPFNALFAHMLGYVGRINDREQAKLDKNNYAVTHHIGKIGVEKYYESLLHGKVGYQNVETNAQGRVLRILDQQNPVRGQDLTLHIDFNLQQVAYKALKGFRGAIVAIDPKTGGILAAVSTPSYDTNEFVNGISHKNYNTLKNNPDIPLFNRILQAQYPPGSIIKPVMGLAGLEEGVIKNNTTINDPGWYKLPDDTRLFRDWKRSGHGKYINLSRSMEESCDVFYYDLAFKLGIKNIHHYYDLFGFGQKTGIDVPSERSGINPSPAWKKSQGRSSWYTGDSLNMGIGQGFMLATPMQLAYATSIIANKGIRRMPVMVSHIEGERVEPILLPPVELKTTQHWEDILIALEQVVHGKRGTARKIAKGLQYRIAGKTGTAQVVGIAQGEKYDAQALKERQRDHALFAGFAPSRNPQIVVAVMLENAGSGAKVAAPIARKIFDAWLVKK